MASGVRVSSGVAVGWIVIGVAAAALEAGRMVSVIAAFIPGPRNPLIPYLPGVLLLILGIVLVGVAVHREHPDSLSVVSGVVNPLATMLLVFTFPSALWTSTRAESFEDFLICVALAAPGLLAAVGARWLSVVASDRRKTTASAI